MAEEEDELLESARADEARFRAFRCFFVIEAFSAGKKVREGLPLVIFRLCCLDRTHVASWKCVAWTEGMLHGGKMMAQGGRMRRT